MKKILIMFLMLTLSEIGYSQVKTKGSDTVIQKDTMISTSRKGPARTGRNPQTGATLQIAAKKVVKFKAGTRPSQRVHRPGDVHHGNTTKTARLKMLADELVNLAVKESPHPHGNNEKYADLKKLADELVNLAAKENPNRHGDNLKYADLKKLADELVNLATKENPNHHGNNLRYADLKKLADELVNLAAKDKDSVGNINWNIKENIGIKKPARTGRNPQTGATLQIAAGSHSQNNPNKPRRETQKISKQFDLSFASGISTPTSNFKNDGFAGNGSSIELMSSYYFSNFGIGLSIGKYKNPTNTNFENFTNAIDFTTLNNSEDWKVSYYGFGPQYKATFNKIEATFMLRAGILSIKPIALQSIYENAGPPILVYSLANGETSKISYWSVGFKIGYSLTQNLSLFVTANYLSALSNGLTITEKKIHDINKNGIIDAEDLKETIGQTADYDITTKNIKPQTANFGIGVSYSFKSRNKKKTNIREGGRTVGAGEPASNITTPRGIEKDDIKRGMVIGNPIVLRDWNPKQEKTKETRKIILTNPKNNSSFRNINEIKNFSWKLMGTKIKDPQYVIKIVKIGKNQQAQRTFIGETSNLRIYAKKVVKFKAQGPNVDTRISNINSVAVGQYKWRVTETSTGISSGYSFFSVSNCDINFTISNETIECLGYEGANRKFKICFDATYSSTSGNLTYTNSSSGLKVYDQNSSPILYTLVSPNPTLVSQNGASTNTVSYCFEVTVPSSVTSIGFGLQGDDLNPNPNFTCQPAANLDIDKLPSCICNDCDRIQTNLTDIIITPKDSLGNQYNISSNISVNVPIYGLEFQVQSYSYTSIPNSCSQGVNSIEQSGMILIPGTTVNGSTSLQLFNETISGSSTTNNNATKVVKYNSNTPLTGQIPINLTIGLPGPLAGLNASCCKMSYQVCIKVIIYYDKDSSKSCVITKCFNFNNQ